MELADLAMYALEKYHIQEQHKWADFPGFSVLTEPRTGKWAALLMRQWDGETGTELQRCDIKCGRECLSALRVPYLTTPFRMKGANWVGVVFDRSTDPGIVCRLLDRAVWSIAGQGYRQQTPGKGWTVVLEDLEDLRGNLAAPGDQKRRGESRIPGRQAKEEGPYFRGTDIPGRELRGTDIPGQEFRGTDMPDRKIRGTDFPGWEIRSTDIPGRDKKTASGPALPGSALPGQREEPGEGGWFRKAGDLTEREYAATAIPEIPQKIRDMMRLYEYRGESLEEKARNFYRQGKFMEDYEDDAPWTGEYRRYYTTYHDLHLAQLRGYFTWRTAVRRREYGPIAASLAYMYIYELLCGIGTVSPEDGFRKMKEFETGYLDAGQGDSAMRRNLHHWMLEFAVLHGIPVETAALYEIPAVADRDRLLAVLKSPEDHTDAEIFDSLCAFGGKKLPGSPVVTGHGEKGKHLFAALWRDLMENYRGSCDIFTACFGEMTGHPWRPLSNAVYWEEHRPQEADYVLNECRIYRCRGGEWTEERYENPYLSGDLLAGLLHAADKGFRKYLKTGHYLRARQEEAWADPYIEAVIAADRKAEEKAALEAARPKITIDLSGLDRIRRDAGITRDSLLTDEEKGFGPEQTESRLIRGTDNSPDVLGALERTEVSPEIPVADSVESMPEASSENTETGQAGNPVEAKDNPAAASTGDVPALQTLEETAEESAGRVPPCETVETGELGLDALHTRILRALLQDRQVGDLIRGNHLMPSIVTDTINEGLFDEIGDNVLECDGDRIEVIEDYREDLAELLGQE